MCSLVAYTTSSTSGEEEGEGAEDESSHAHEEVFCEEVFCEEAEDCSPTTKDTISEVKACLSQSHLESAAETEKLVGGANVTNVHLNPESLTASSEAEGERLDDYEECPLMKPEILKGSCEVEGYSSDECEEGPSSMFGVQSADQEMDVVSEGDEIVEVKKSAVVQYLGECVEGTPVAEVNANLESGCESDEMQALSVPGGAIETTGSTEMKTIVTESDMDGNSMDKDVVDLKGQRTAEHDSRQRSEGDENTVRGGAKVDMDSDRSVVEAGGQDATEVGGDGAKDRGTGTEGEDSREESAAVHEETRVVHDMDTGREHKMIDGGDENIIGDKETGDCHEGESKVLYSEEYVEYEGDEGDAGEVEQVPQNKTEGTRLVNKVLEVLSVHSPTSSVDTGVPSSRDGHSHVTLQPNIYARRHQKKEKVYDLVGSKEPDAAKEHQQPKSEEKVQEQWEKEKQVQKKEKEKQKLLTVDREKLVKVLQQMLEEKEKEEKLKEEQQSAKNKQEEGKELESQQSSEAEYYQESENYGEQYYGEAVYDPESGQYYYPEQEYYQGEDGQYHVWNQEQGYSEQGGDYASQELDPNQQYVGEGSGQDPKIRYPDHSEPGEHQGDSSQAQQGVESSEAVGQQHLDPNQQYQASNQEYSDPNQQYVDQSQQSVDQNQEYLNSSDPSQVYAEYYADPNDPNQQYVDPNDPNQQYTDPNDPNQQYAGPNDPNQQYVYGDPNQQHGSWDESQYYGEEQCYEQAGYEEYGQDQQQYIETEEQKYDRKYPPPATSLPSEQPTLKVSSQQAVPTTSPQQAVPMMSPQQAVPVPMVSPQQAIPMLSPSQPMAAAQSMPPRPSLEASQPSPRSSLPTSTPASVGLPPPPQSQPVPSPNLLPHALKGPQNPMLAPPPAHMAAAAAPPPPGQIIEPLPPALMQQQRYPPIHQVPPSSHQPPPSSHQPPPSSHLAPPNYQAPPSSHHAPPPSHQAPPPSHQAPPPSHQAPPPSHQALPFREQGPPFRQQGPPNQQAPIPGHQAPPFSHQAPPFSHQAPPPSHQGLPYSQQAPIPGNQTRPSGHRMPLAPPKPLIPPTLLQLEFRSNAPTSGSQQHSPFQEYCPPLAANLMGLPLRPLFEQDQLPSLDVRHAVPDLGHRCSPLASPVDQMSIQSQPPVPAHPDLSQRQVPTGDHQQLGLPVPSFHPSSQSEPPSRPTPQGLPLAHSQSHLPGAYHHTPSPTSQSHSLPPTNAPPPTSLAYSHHPSPTSASDHQDYDSKSDYDKSDRTGRLSQPEEVHERRWPSSGRETFRDNRSEPSDDEKFHPRFHSRDGSRWSGDRKRDSTRRYHYSWRSDDIGDHTDNFYMARNDYPGRRKKNNSNSSSRSTSNVPKDPRSKKAESSSERSNAPQHYSKTTKYTAALNYVEKRSSMLRVSSKTKQSDKDRGPPLVKPHAEEPLASPKKKGSESSQSSKCSSKCDEASSGPESKKSLSRFKIPKHKGSAEPAPMPVSSLAKSDTKIPALDLHKEKPGDSKSGDAPLKKEREEKQSRETADEKEDTKDSSVGKSSKSLSEDKHDAEKVKTDETLAETNTAEQQTITGQDSAKELVFKNPSLEVGTEKKPADLKPVVSEGAVEDFSVQKIPDHTSSPPSSVSSVAEAGVSVSQEGLVAVSVLKSSNAAALVEVSKAAASDVDKMESVDSASCSANTVAVVPVITPSIAATVSTTSTTSKETAIPEVASSLTVGTNISCSTTTPTMSSSAGSTVTVAPASGKPSSARSRKKGSEGSKGKGRRKKTISTATASTTATTTTSSTGAVITSTATSAAAPLAAAIASTLETATGVGKGSEAKKNAVVPGIAITGKGPAPDWSALLQRLDPALVQALAATVQQTLKQTSIDDSSMAATGASPSKALTSVTPTSTSTSATPTSALIGATPALTSVTPTSTSTSATPTSAFIGATPTSAGTIPTAAPIGVSSSQPAVSATPSTALPGTSTTPTTTITTPTSSSISTDDPTTNTSAAATSVSVSDKSIVVDEKVARRIATLRSSTIAVRYSSSASTSPSPAPSSRAGTPHSAGGKTGRVASPISPPSRTASRSSSPAVLTPTDSTVDTRVLNSHLVDSTSSTSKPSAALVVTSSSGQGSGVVTATVITRSDIPKLATTTVGDKVLPGIVSSSLSADEKLHHSDTASKTSVEGAKKAAGGNVENMDVHLPYVTEAEADRKSSTPASEFGILDESSTAAVLVDSNYHVMYKEYNLRRSRSQTISPRPGGKTKADGSIAAGTGKRDRPADNDRSSEEKAAKKMKVEEAEKANEAERGDETVKVEEQVKVEKDATGSKLQKEVVEEAVREPVEEPGSLAKVSTLKRKASTSLGARSRKKQKVGAAKKTESVERSLTVCALCLRKDSEHNLGFLFGPHKPQVNEEPGKVEVENNRSGVGNGVEEKKSTLLWVHEDCAVWAPGVCLVGGKLLGLHDAVADGKKLTCRSCKRVGATLCCHSRACKAVYHYPCAEDAGCSFKEEQFLISCPKHKLPS